MDSPPNEMPSPVPDDAATADPSYASRLRRLQFAGWKQALDVQRPYRWNLRRQEPGFTLDVGCGIGRNLDHLGGNGVGVDHNADAVATARDRGFTAFTPEEFLASEYAVAGRFDTLLCAHVVEHMTRAQAAGMLGGYLPYVRPGGQVILITPQERGYRSDATHVEFADFDALDRLLGDLGLRAERRRSFPFPRLAGKVFTYNEFMVTARTAH